MTGKDFDCESKFIMDDSERK